MTGSKQALLLALLGGVLFGATLLHAGDEGKTLRAVAEVRRSGAPEAPARRGR